MENYWELGVIHLAVSGLTVRLPVWPWQQVCVKPVRKWGVRATWIFIVTSPVYWLQCGGHTQVRLFGPPESTVNWPGRRREEGGSELIAHIRVIQVLPVADKCIDEDGCDRKLGLMVSYWKLGVMEGWVWWRAGCAKELLRAGCDGELGVMESYWELGVMERWVWRRTGYDRELLRAGCDEELGAMVSYWELSVMERWVWWRIVESWVW